MANNKNFTKRPADYSFFQDRQEEPAAAVQADPEETTGNSEYYLNPKYIEKKTKRVQLVFKPSTYNKAKQLADAEGLSLNEYIHKIIEDQ